MGTQITSMVAEYGPRTTVLVCLDDGVYEFSYGCTPEGCQLADGSFAPWICSRHHIQIQADSKIFSPGNMRSSQEVRAHLTWPSVIESTPPGAQERL